MDQPHPIQYALALVTAFDGDTSRTLDAIKGMDPEGQQVHDRFVVTGLVGMVQHLADRLAERDGTTRQATLQRYALEVADRIEITDA